MPTQDKHPLSHAKCWQINLLACKLTKPQQLPNVSIHQFKSPSTHLLTNLSSHQLLYASTCLLVNLSTRLLGYLPTCPLVNLSTRHLNFPSTCQPILSAFQQEFQHKNRPFYPPTPHPIAKIQFSRGFVLVQNGALIIHGDNPLEVVLICKYFPIKCHLHPKKLLLAAKRTAFSTKTHCVLRHIAPHLASKRTKVGVNGVLFK